MEECRKCSRPLAADLGEAAALCTGGCGRLFHARCTSLAGQADVSVAAYLSHERRWRCADCQEKCAACSDSVASGAFAGVVRCGGGCDRLFHADCTELAAVADLRQYLTVRRAWACGSCRGRRQPESTRPQTPGEQDAGAGRVERGDVEAICRSMLEVEKCLEQFSRKLELFEKDVMSVNGCVRAASEELSKKNAENQQLGEEIEQLATEVERAAVAVPEVEESPAEVEAGVGGKDAPKEVAAPRVAGRREKSLSVGGRRRNGHDPRSERVPVLYRLTKQFARENDYRLVWIHHADVFLRKRPGSSARKVKHKDDLRADDAPVTAPATRVT